MARNQSTAQSASFDHTDVGNAKRLVHHFGHELRHCERGWYAFDGVKWARDEKTVVRHCMDTVEMIQSEVDACGSFEVRELKHRHYRRSKKEPRLRAMRRLAATMEEVSCSQDDFDAKPRFLNTPNGTYDLKRGVLREHRAVDLLSRVTAAEYDEGATCPQFLDFLRWACCYDEEMMRFIQKALGYSLTGYPKEHLFILHGPGGNGKGTLTYVVQHALGDYAVQGTNELFIKNKKDTHPDQVAMLRGARFVVAAEFGASNKIDEVMLKQLTGGDRIVSRRMYEGHEEFEASQAYWISTNRLPRIGRMDDALRRRIFVLPFENSYDEQDPTLKKRLTREAPGILNWLIEGYHLYREERLRATGRVRKATEQYFLAPNGVARFALDCCLKEVGSKVKCSDVYETYQRWCDLHDEVPVKKRTFNKRLVNAGYPKRHSNGNQFYFFNLRLTDDWRSVEVEHLRLAA